MQIHIDDSDSALDVETLVASFLFSAAVDAQVIGQFTAETWGPDDAFKRLITVFRAICAMRAAFGFSPVAQAN